MGKIDMHVHTFNSDGELSPVNAFIKAKTDGVKKMVITDHNVLYDDECYKKIAKKLKIHYLMGTEISTSQRGIHILAYGDNRLMGMLPKLATVENAKQCYIYETIYRLTKNKQKINLKLMRERKFNKIKELILNNRYNFTQTDHKMNDETMDKMNSQINANLTMAELDNYCLMHDISIGNDFNSKEYRSKFLTPKQAIDMIHECHGIAVLAHPQTITMYDDTVSFRETIKWLIRNDIDGFEVALKTTEGQIEFLKRYKKLITYGTDYHRSIYSMGVENEENTFEQTKELIKTR